MSLVGQARFNTDSGAPALTGQAGSLVTLLDAVLVNGYGTGPAAKAPLGWSIAWSATNQRVYRNDPVLGTGLHLHVDDTGSGTGGAKDALVRGYITWDAGLGVGANPFPTVAQLAGGYVWRKSITADSTARAWVIAGNALTFYPMLDSASQVRQAHWAGDVRSFRPADATCFGVGGGVTQNAAVGTAASTAFNSTHNGHNAGSSTKFGRFARSAAGVTDSPIAACIPPCTVANTTMLGPYGSTYLNTRAHPGIVSGGLDTTRILVCEGNYAERGYFAGVHAPLAAAPFSDLSLQLGAGPNGGDLLPVNYRDIANAAGSSNNGQLLFELGVDW